MEKKARYVPVSADVCWTPLRWGFSVCRLQVERLCVSRLSMGTVDAAGVFGLHYAVEGGKEMCKIMIGVVFGALVGGGRDGVSGRVSGGLDASSWKFFFG